MTEWKQTLLSQDSYEELKRISGLYSEKFGVRRSYGEIISELAREKTALESLPGNVRNYIYEYLRELVKDDNVLGVRLFGSVAKGTYGKYSDIDLFIVVKSDLVSFMRKTDEIDKKLEGIQKEIFKTGYGFYVSPLIVSVKSLESFKPIYLEIALYGVTLFDVEDTIDRFITRIRRDIKYHRYENGGGEIEWRKN